MQVTIAQAKESEHSQVLSFYRRCGYQAQIGREDIVYAARDQSQIVGVGKLCIENNILILRGLQVLPEFKRRGVARQILGFLDRQIGTRECFCMPWENLEPLLADFGFRRVEFEAAPFHLRIRYEKYVNDGMPIVIMARNPQPHHGDI